MESYKNFFSVVVPARNEEKYISKTLESLRAMNYPKNRYEIIVVESGSNDRTYSIALKFRSSLIKVYHLERRGVSVGRNYGATKSSKKCDWLIFFDADCIPDENFLSDINNFLIKHPRKSFYAGTTKIVPLEDNFKIKVFLELYSIWLRIFRASFAMQLIRRDLFEKVKYDENLRLGEDYVILRELRKYGKFFFLSSTKLKTSIRRFEHQGIVKTLFFWIMGSILPRRIKKNIEYKVIR